MLKFKKLKKSTKQYIIVASLCVVVIGGAATTAYAVMFGQLKDKYESLEESIRGEMESNQRSVYVATTQIGKGEFITVENTEYKTVYATQPAESYITEDDIGKTTIINIDEGIQVLKAMVNDEFVGGDVREVSFNTILLNSNIINNDTVDIRIQYPSGENFVVLSKKIVKLPTETLEESYYWLTEEEILLMSSAIVDAYLYQGSALYTAKYVEPNIQESSFVTYTPSLSNINLIKDNPNIVEIASKHLNAMVRKELENRLSKSLNQDVSEIEWTVDTSKSQKNTDSSVVTDDSGFTYYVEEEEDKEEQSEFGE